MIAKVFEWIMRAYLTWRVERALHGSPDTPLSEKDFSRLQRLLKLEKR